MKVIIAGSRTFNDYETLRTVCNNLLKDKEKITVVCGGASGADRLGEQWAKEHNHPVKWFLPEWKTYGRTAGPLRNINMADYADILICFWDGESRGSKHMIDTARARDLEVHVIRTDEKGG